MAHGRSGHESHLVKRTLQADPWDPDEIFAHYARRLTRVAEQYLSRKLAGRLDGEDVVQSVFRTFFRRSARGEFQIDSSAQLWRLLVKMTLQKARAKGRHNTAERRDVKAEVSGDAQGWLVEATVHEPGPAEAAALVDQINVMLRGLPPIYCQILDLRLQGWNTTEIARQLGISRQTVYRALALLQQRLKDADASC
jgi:RNA polymerase sigma-70 factor (ECF subfamily)